MSSRKPKATRELILQAARRLLEGETGATAGLEQVAAAAGVSRQAVYLHFGSRTQLLLELVRYLADAYRMPERVQAIMAMESATAVLDGIVDLHAEFNGQILVAANALDVARRGDAAAAKAWDDRMRLRHDGVRQLVARLAADGRLRTAVSIDDAADIVWLLLSVRVWEDLVIVRGWSRKKYARHIKRVLRKSIIAPHANS